MDKDTVDRFLEELTRISRHYGISVSGCGCCSSPFLNYMDEDERNTYNADDEITR